MTLLPPEEAQRLRRGLLEQLRFLDRFIAAGEDLALLWACPACEAPTCVRCTSGSHHLPRRALARKADREHEALLFGAGRLELDFATIEAFERELEKLTASPLSVRMIEALGELRPEGALEALQ